MLAANDEVHAHICRRQRGGVSAEASAGDDEYGEYRANHGYANFTSRSHCPPGDLKDL
jgi:hypothetical protein